jgi:tRNA pseudouridine38-40 synthase
MGKMRNIRLIIAYDGTGFGGWQRQKNAVTIQGEIEKRLTVMTACPVSLLGAGRTDAGVHALGMVANFHTEKNIPCEAFLRGLNSMLPQNIRILGVEDAPADFHARFSAKGKTYIYKIFTGPVLLPAERFDTYHIPFPLQFEHISDCLMTITGTHNFASFERPGSRDKSQIGGRGTIRTILAANFHDSGNHCFQFTITGDGFLRQMIRIMIGTILEVGRGRRNLDCFRQTLQSRDRAQAGAPAPAHGLTLLEIFY